MFTLEELSVWWSGRGQACGSNEDAFVAAGAWKKEPKTSWFCQRREKLNSDLEDELKFAEGL